MTDSVQKEKLAFVINEVSDISFNEKRNTKTEEEIINTFLDAILVFEKELTDKTEKINFISEKIEEISWFSGFSEEDLRELNDLIAVAREVRASLIRQYISFNFFRLKGIAKNQILLFKQSIDNFTETYSDIDSILFKLPNNTNFQDTTRQLDSL